MITSNYEYYFYLVISVNLKNKKTNELCDDPIFEHYFLSGVAAGGIT